MAQALAYNALAFIVMPVVGWSLFQSLRSWKQQLPLTPSSSTSRYLKWLLAITVIAFGVLRNLPWFPFTLLAPHEI